jgi:hypothetical protein
MFYSATWSEQNQQKPVPAARALAAHAIRALGGESRVPPHDLETHQPHNLDGLFLGDPSDPFLGTVRNVPFTGVRMENSLQDCVLAEHVLVIFQERFQSPESDLVQHDLAQSEDLPRQIVPAAEGDSDGNQEVKDTSECEPDARTHATLALEHLLDRLGWTQAVGCMDVRRFGDRQEGIQSRDHRESETLD